METQNGSQVIGTAVVVYGQVKVDSVDGVTRTIQPNNLIKLNDRIDTGHDGSVTIIFDDGNDSQLDLGQMTNIVIDQDVFDGGETFELSDAAIEPHILQNLLEGWNVLVPGATIETVIPDVVEVTDIEDPVRSDTVIDVSDTNKTNKVDANLASAEADDEGIGSIDDDLDLSNLIPPPDDVS